MFGLPLYTKTRHNWKFKYIIIQSLICLSKKSPTSKYVGFTFSASNANNIPRVYNLMDSTLVDPFLANCYNRNATILLPNMSQIHSPRSNSLAMATTSFHRIPHCQLVLQTTFLSLLKQVNGPHCLQHFQLRQRAGSFNQLPELLIPIKRDMLP